MGLDIPNPFVPLFLIASLCGGVLLANSLICLFAGKGKRPLLLSLGIASTIGFLGALFLAIWSFPYLAAPALANTRFSHTYFAAYQHQYLPNMMLDFVIIITTITLTLLIVRTHLRLRGATSNSRG